MKKTGCTVTGIWNRITIYCTNHENPVPMVVAKNEEYIKTPFYACENYAKKDVEDCPNRLNLDDYQGLVLKFEDAIAKDPFADFTGYRFVYKGARQKISVRVLKYDNKEIRLGIFNNTVFGR